MAYRYSHRLKIDLSSTVDRLIYARVLRVIDNLTSQQIELWSLTHHKKLESLRRLQNHSNSNHSQPSYKIEVVKNFSKKKLTDEESQAEMSTVRIFSSCPALPLSALPCEKLNRENFLWPALSCRTGRYRVGQGRTLLVVFIQWVFITINTYVVSRRHTSSRSLLFVIETK